MSPLRAPRVAPIVCGALSRRVVAVAVLSLVTAGSAFAQGPVPQGGEFRISDDTLASAGPHVAMDADGDFVVARLGGGVYARRYSAEGVPQGAEFRVDTTPTGTQESLAVGMDADGDFVVVWGTRVSSNTPPLAYARLYAADGTPRGDDFRAGGSSPGPQYEVTSAMGPGGDFAVAWTAGDPDDWFSTALYTQRFTAAGAPQGGPDLVSAPTYPPSERYLSPSMAVEADGDHVVAWTFSALGTTLRTEVLARRLDAAGVPLGGVTTVNSYGLGYQGGPSVAVDGEGNVVVVWTSQDVYANLQDGSGSGVYAQRFEASGQRSGGEFRVNTYTTGYQNSPDVVMDDSGGFVVVWQSGSVYSPVGQDGSFSGIYAQRYSPGGAPLGTEFRVNTTTAGDQGAPSVATSDDGDLVVVWRGSGAEGEGTYGQRYTLAPVAAEAGPPSGLALTFAPSPAGPAGGRVRYTLPEAARVRLSVADVLGREASVLWDGEQAAGPHEARLDAARLAPGVYVVRLEAGAETVVRRVTVVR